MNQSVPINKLAEQMGLTSRTLRHWEAEGLFQSERDPSSGWRTYDENALHQIRTTALLRRMDLSLRDIQSILADPSIARLRSILDRKLTEVQSHQAQTTRYHNQLEQFQHFLHQQKESVTVDHIMQETEVLWMPSATESSTVRIITLPAMRAVYHIAVSVSPEDEAMVPVREWMEEAGLLSTARFYGGNVKPMPSKPGKPYGYGMLATLPEGVAVPPHLKEMRLPGGLYAMHDNSEDVSASWRTLLSRIAEDGVYQSDRSRLCLEEHIRNEKPSGCGNEYHLILLEPVKAIKAKM